MLKRKVFIILIILFLNNIHITEAQPIKSEKVLTNNKISLNNYKTSETFVDSLTKANQGQNLDNSNKLQYNKFAIDIGKEDNYLYAYPPYPLPATNYVQFLLYWDTTLDIKDSEIAVYDINGNKICGKEKFILDQMSLYNGIMTWNSSGIDRGIYIIQIKHGTKTETVKVMIE